MRALRTRFPLNRPSLPGSVIVGLAAGGAYLLEQGLDRRVAPNGYDDLVLWGGLLSRNRGRQMGLGLLVHSALSVALAALYAALLPMLPNGPRWLRGVVFVQMENALLYPGVPVINAIHPEVRSGYLPSLLTWRYFWVEAARHVAYGVVLGVLTPDVRAVADHAERRGT